MILYEYELSIKNKGIARREFEVKECDKTYKCIERIDNKDYWGNHNFGYQYRSTLSKDMVDTGAILNDYDKLLYYSVSNDVQIVRKLFMEYINEKIIPNYEQTLATIYEKIKDARECCGQIMTRYVADRADSRCDINEEYLKADKDKLKEIATNIVHILENCEFDNVMDGSGYYTIKEFENGTDRAIDVYKSMDGSNPHYVVYCSYENEQSDYKYTDDLSVEGLLEKIEEVYNLECLFVEHNNIEDDLDR